MFEHMCYTILDKVDGINIFPKLAVYNCLHYKNYKFNRRAKGATKAIVEKMKGIDAIHILTSLASAKNDHTVAETRNDNVEITVTTNSDDVIDTNIAANDDEAMFPPIPAAARLMPASMPQQLAQISPTTCRPFHSTMYVAGMPIAHEIQPISIIDNAPKQKRVRLGDEKNRKPRTCAKCHKKECPMAKPGHRKRNVVCMEDNSII